LREREEPRREAVGRVRGFFFGAGRSVEEEKKTLTRMLERAENVRRPLPPLPAIA
jgi:hypothetical protein